MTRRGVAVVLALAIVLVLGCFAGVLFRHSQGASREVDALSGHLRALAIADAAYAEAVSRLSECGWDGRWFKGAPEARRDVDAVGGNYDSVIRDAPGNTDLPTLPVLMTDVPDGQAELLVRARWRSHSTVCVWRILVPRDGFDELARIVPTYFSHLPDDTPVDVSALDPLAGKIDEMVKRRDRNRARFEGQRPLIDSSVEPKKLSGVLNMPQPPPAVDELPSQNGGPGLPLPNYIDQVKNSQPGPPAWNPGGTWSEPGWRGWRVGGTGGTGTRARISDRTARGTDEETAQWGAWPGWNPPGSTPPWAGPGWDGWQRWGAGQTAQPAGGGGSGGDTAWLQALLGLLGGGGGGGGGYYGGRRGGFGGGRRGR